MFENISKRDVGMFSAGAITGMVAGGLGTYYYTTSESAMAKRIAGASAEQKAKWGVKPLAAASSPASSPAAAPAPVN